MKKIVLMLLLALALTGCAATTVYIPEEAGKAEDGVLVYIPADPDKEEVEATAPVTPTETEPEETEPELKNSATVSKKTTSSSKKGTTSNKNNTPNKETVTGNTQPAATESPTEAPQGGSAQITATVPAESAPAATEPEETEPAATEPPVTEPPVTEPPATEPEGTEPPATDPPVTDPPLYDISDYVVSDLEYAMLDRINEYRLEEDLEELWLDEYLCAIASCRGYEASLVWSHTRPDGRGYWTVLDDYGYGCGAAGELLGYSTGDGAAVIDKWMSSESHRALLMGDSGTVGIGIYCSGGVIYVACLLVG